MHRAGSGIGCRKGFVNKDLEETGKKLRKKTNAGRFFILFMPPERVVFILKKSKSTTVNGCSLSAPVSRGSKLQVPSTSTVISTVQQSPNFYIESLNESWHQSVNNELFMRRTALICMESSKFISIWLLQP